MQNSKCKIQNLGTLRVEYKKLQIANGKWQISELRWQLQIKQKIENVTENDNTVGYASMRTAQLIFGGAKPFHPCA